MTKEQLNEQLNEDLVAEFTGIIQYVTYAAKATGPYQPQLSQFLGAVPDEQMHAQYLTNKIVELGGTPVIDAAPIKPRPLQTKKC